MHLLKSIRLNLNCGIIQPFFCSHRGWEFPAGLQSVDREIRSGRINIALNLAIKKDFCAGLASS
jgi:hypothetical protein